MAKITVEIDIPNTTADEITNTERDLWFEGDDDHIIVDEAYLPRFPEEDSFYQLRFIKVED